MNTARIKFIFLVVMAAAVLANGAAAVEGIYVGVHGGKTLLKENAKRELNEDHYSGGLTIGLEALEFRQSLFVIEADFSIPLTKGSSEDFGDWELSTVGLYGCLRVGRNAAFFKAKVGMIYEKLELSAHGAEGANDLGLSLGIGGGAWLGKAVFVELEAVIIDENMGFLRSMVGYHF